MSNLDDMNLVETLTVVCFLQVIALTLFTPSSSKFWTKVYDLSLYSSSRRFSNLHIS